MIGEALNSLTAEPIVFAGQVGKDSTALSAMRAGAWLALVKNTISWAVRFVNKKNNQV